DLARVAGRLGRIDQEVVLALDPLAVVDEWRGRCRGGFRRGRAVVAGRGGRAAGSRRRSSSGGCGRAARCRCRRGGTAAGGGRRGRLDGVAIVVMAARGQREQGGTQEWQTLEHGNLVIGGTWDRRRRPGSALDQSGRGGGRLAIGAVQALDVAGQR